MQLTALTNRAQFWIIGILALFIYVNTVQNEFALDDAIVFSQNNFTKKGFSGINDIFSHDTFEGFFGKRGSSLIQGGRYRPLSLVTFAVEYEFWGLRPELSHFINALLFAMTCLLIFKLLHQINTNETDLWPFWAVLLYAVHPIHAEAVANIKGRDEIMAMLFSVLTLILLVRYIQSEKMIHLLLAGSSYFLALLSKENSITFIAILPLTYWLFFKPTGKNYGLALTALLVPALLFLAMRHQFSPTGILNESKEILNNPFARANFSQRYGTVIAAFLYYLWLLFVPLHLTHDYYFNQIPYSELLSTRPILAAITVIGLVVIVFKTYRNRPLIAYGIGYFLLTYSVVSNLLFSVGIIINERFLFMPSLGFCILLGYGFDHLILHNDKTKKLGLIFLALVTIAFSARTIARNADWKDNLTLLRHDVTVSENSSKANTTFGGLLMEDLDKRKDTLGSRQIQLLALTHLQKALKIYPENGDAWLLLGNAYYKYFRNPTEAIKAYQNANICKGGSFDALYNCGAVALDAKNPHLAVSCFKNANQINPNQYKCLVNWAEAYIRLNQPDSALMIIQAGLSATPNDAYLTHQMGKVYGQFKNDLPNALPWLMKATQLSPQALDYWEDYAVANGMYAMAFKKPENFQIAIDATQHMLQINPNSATAYGLMAVSYANLGNKAEAQRCQQMAQQLSGRQGASQNH